MGVQNPSQLLASSPSARFDMATPSINKAQSKTDCLLCFFDCVLCVIDPDVQQVIAGANCDISM